MQRCRLVLYHRQLDQGGFNHNPLLISLYKRLMDQHLLCSDAQMSLLYRLALQEIAANEEKVIMNPVYLKTGLRAG